MTSSSSTLHEPLLQPTGTNTTDTATNTQTKITTTNTTLQKTSTSIPLLLPLLPLVLLAGTAERLFFTRVAQSTPLPGGPGRLAYIHTAPALLEPLTAFAAWPLGREFALAELPARDPFLGACAARALLGLDVLDVLAEGAEPGAGGSVDIA